MEIKPCTKCHELKPRTVEFYSFHSKARDGFQSWCRVCRSEYQKAKYRSDPEYAERRRHQQRARNALQMAEHVEYSRQWRAANRDRYNAHQRERYQRPDVHEYHRRYSLRWNRARIGFTPELIERLVVEQEGRCAICRAEFGAGWADMLRADHDHATGLARGLLCFHCNTAIGHFRDDPARLEAAAAYLRRYAE